MRPTVALPTEDSDDGELARALARALGTALQPGDGTAAGADALGLGGALADARQALRDLVEEAFPDAAYDLLDEYEAAYGLPVAGTPSAATRRARLLAKVRAQRGAQPDRIAAAVRALDPTAAVRETAVASVPQEADGATATIGWGARRKVYHVAVQLADAVYDDPGARARVEALLEQMKPAHLTYALHTNAAATGFRFSGEHFGRDAFFKV